MQPHQTALQRIVAIQVTVGLTHFENHRFNPDGRGFECARLDTRNRVRHHQGVFGGVGPFLPGCSSFRVGEGIQAKAPTVTSLTSLSRAPEFGS